MKWQKGQQGGGYEFMTLFTLGDLEVHMVRVRAGQKIDGHVNECCSTKDLHKLVVWLKKAEEGGEFICEPPAIFNSKRLMYMIPSKMYHELEEVTKGESLMLFIAWTQKK